MDSISIGNEQVFFRIWLFLVVNGLDVMSANDKKSISLRKETVFAIIKNENANI